MAELTIFQEPTMLVNTGESDKNQTRHNLEVSNLDLASYWQEKPHDSPPSDEVTSARQLDSEAYSVLTTPEKYIAVVLVTSIAMFSPLSSFIFFPAIKALSEALDVFLERINLTITSYMVVAGVAPTILGDMADITGRRNVYLLTLFVYVVANIGQGVQSSWIALFLLRMLQSAGGAATIAMGYGVISDIAAPSERAGYVGVVLLGPNFATAIGPIVGSASVEGPGWRWIFWVPALIAGTLLFGIALFLPETARSIVGNGSRKVSALYQPLIKFGPSRESAGDQEEAIPRKFRIPNPLASLRILISRSSILITAINGIYYMDFSCLQSSMSSLFTDIYGLSEIQDLVLVHTYQVFLHAHLSLQSEQSNILVASLTILCQGKIMNRDYKLTARAHNIVIDVSRGDDLRLFPIEKARFRSIWYPMCATGISTIGYGWALKSRSCCNTLLTDLNPKSPVTAQAANNIVRCSLAGIGLAFLQVCLDAIGPGWTFTLFGALCMGCLVPAFLEWRYGQGWRQE
ncbi:MFS general substrate transporter [Penicillium malachiteum]|nr:MFS general substrate transporter [Penicillium malachiteum]